MAKTDKEASLLPAQIKSASKVFDATASAKLKDADAWQSIVDIIKSDESGALKKQLSALCKERFLIAWRVKFGRDLTLEEIDRCKKSASSVFSEYTANGGTRKVRAPKKTDADIEAEKQAAIKEALAKAGVAEVATIEGHTATMAAPSTIRQVEEARDALNAVQAELMAFQTTLAGMHIAVPVKTELGSSIGLISQHVVDVTNQVVELLKTLS